MLINLDMSMREMLLEQNKFTAFAPTVTLTNIKKSDERGAAYCGTFSCKFENINENSEIILRGIAYFDKNCNITKEGNGKAGILVMMVTENMKQLDLDSCIYNLPQFN